MASVVPSAFNRKLFSVLWIATLLILPWQTRWFRDVSLGGWPWEQGRMSVYVSWVLVIATVYGGRAVAVRQMTDSSRRRFLRAGFVCLVLSLLTLLVNDGRDLRLRAMSQWTVQVGLLIAFAWTLWRARIKSEYIASTVVVSLIPQVILGFWQYATQRVGAQKWLGIAEHLSSVAGTSVVEHGDFRVLRMYGGFPHPTICGAWLACGVLLAVWLATVSRSKWMAIVWSACSAAFAGALVITYARGAWIAGVVGLVALVIVLLRKRRTHGGVERSFLLCSLACIGIASIVIGYTERDHVRSRFDTTQRLEAQSVQARTQSMADGMQLIQRHPFFGTGVNAELLDIYSSANRRLPQPLESPHTVYELVVVNLGVFGSLFVLWLIYRVRSVLAQGWVWVLPLSVLALFDHFLWSYWSGQALVMIVGVFLFLEQENRISNP